LEKEDRVLDLFCGLGNFTLAIARYCREVVGVEGNDEMVKRGEENSLLNKISNATFHQANLNKNIENKSWLSTPFTKILIDPPRSGVIEIITQIANLRAEKIVYVSCNLATLARDSALLVAEGYRLKSYGVVDMFPHTAHVESIVQFELMN
jgi:23S rRNA (uracil1939-C5)-methyltransferase